LAIQLKHCTNAFVINDASLLSPAKKATISFDMGEKQRRLAANQEIRLFNTRLRINNKSSVGFGAAIRSYISAKTSQFNWQDTIGDLREFLKINTNNAPLSADIRANSWVEIFGTYARNLKDDGNTLLNGGITLKVNRGLGGAYLNATNLNFSAGTLNGRPGYLQSNGQVEYGYSSNFDELDSNGSTGSKMRRFLNKTYSTIGFSLGAEYIVLAEDKEDVDYELKIGVSLLDISYNSFQYSSNSRFATLDKVNISDSVIQSTFENINGINDLPDSLQNIAGTIKQPIGNFWILQPARLVVNADKHLSGNFFINGELTLPLVDLAGKKNLFTRDINLFALTPRYEDRFFGFYLPITFNTNNQFWIGGAFRIGPLLLGIHNWGNLFAKNKLQNGGGYLAFTFRPGNKHTRSTNENSSGMERDKLPRKLRKQLSCPVL
jgi:hypothetical protein